MVFDWEHIQPLSDSLKARVFSPTNIALGKYWGKRDKALNLPENSSVSVTLDGFGSFTTVEFHQSFDHDVIYFEGREQPTQSSFHKKAVVVLDLLRARAHGPQRLLRARIQTRNNLPTGAGLASSAAGLSALTLAAAHALDQTMTPAELSAIARQGSGSAARSFFGGFVQWNRGTAADGHDSAAFQLKPASHWPLRVAVAVIEDKSKQHPSTTAMETTKATSPYFRAWVETAEAQVPALRSAIEDKNFQLLADLTETNCLRMHASAMAAEPPIVYFEPTTLQVIQTVWAMRRQQGIQILFTIDAGPNVVVLYANETSQEQIDQRLRSVSGVKRVIHTTLGAGPHLLDQPSGGPS